MARQGKYTCHRRQSSSWPLDTRRQVLQLVHELYSQAVKTGRIRFIHPNPPVYIPRMDILDDPSSSRMVATFELPGVRSDQITLSLQQGIMRIYGKRVPRTLEECRAAPTTQTSKASVDNATPSDANTPSESGKYVMQELRYGPFKREIELPHGVKEGDIIASLKDGLLTVTWPRNPYATIGASSDPLIPSIKD